MGENEIKLENSVSENPHNNNKSRISTSIIVTILVCFVVMISVVFGMIHYYNAKEVRKDAISRVNALCDEINSYSAEIDDSKLYTLDEKLKEVDTIVEENNLDSVYVDKYLYCKNYVNDMKLYKEITNAVESGEPSEWTNIQTNINSLKTDSIRAKIDGRMVASIKDKVEKTILYNTLKYYENHIEKKEAPSYITRSYYFYVPRQADKNQLLSVPSTEKINYVYTKGFGYANGFQNSDDYMVNYSDGDSDSVNAAAIQKAISDNREGGFAVEYRKGDRNWINYISFTYDVSVKYENDSLQIILNTSNNGTENIDLKQALNKSLIYFSN